MKRALIALSFLLLPGAAAQALDTPRLDVAVEQLRQAAGRWNVTTTRYADNGAVAAVATGTWSFDWVVPDRVLSGRSTISGVEMPGKGCSGGAILSPENSMMWHCTSGVATVSLLRKKPPA